MGRMITVDPITRIEGHLRIDVEVDRGKVQNSWSSGQMWRGIEKILEGRDPRDAWIYTQRICGVCTTVHAIASVRAVENALNIDVPLNAQLIRNIIIAAHALHDHIVHFYHLSALDWVDVVSALKGNPVKAAILANSLSPWPHNSAAELQAVKDKLNDFVSKGQLGIFTNGYWGHPAMKLPPDVNLLAVHHYLQALEYQKKALKAVAILGSKTPNIQNLAVGGVANAINLDNQATLNMAKLYMIKELLVDVKAFVEQVYLPDVAAIGAMYAPWLSYGAGVTNYLAVPDMPLNSAGTEFDLPGGTIMNGDLGSIKTIDSFDDPFQWFGNEFDCVLGTQARCLHLDIHQRNRNLRLLFARQRSQRDQTHRQRRENEQGRKGRGDERTRQAPGDAKAWCFREFTHVWSPPDHRPQDLIGPRSSRPLQASDAGRAKQCAGPCLRGS